MEQRTGLFLGILVSSIAAFAISYGTAWSVRVASSTTYSMVGALNKLPVALSGILFFSNERASFNLGSMLSVAVAFGSGIVYSWSQVELRKQKEQDALLAAAKADPPVHINIEGTTIVGLKQSRSLEKIPKVPPPTIQPGHQ